MEDGSYFQPFTMPGALAGLKTELGKPNTLALSGPDGHELPLKLKEDFIPLGLSATAKVSGGLVFAGYGITTDKGEYDDYKGLDVAGKIVVVLRRTPADGPNNPIEGGTQGPHAGLVTKILTAEQHKAAAVLFVNDASQIKAGDPLMDFEYTSRDQGSTKLPAAHLRRDLADAMLRSGLGKTLREVEQAMDKDYKPVVGPLEGWTATVEANVKRVTLNVKNVVGVLEGAGPLARETVIIGAHYDHLGLGGPGSLARGLKQPEIHHGADDNASGTTTMIELARRFGAMKDRQGRRLVFMAFSGEESGLLGSAYYCKNPIFPLADTVAMLNLDMVGRMSKDSSSEKDKLLVEGSGTAKNFEELLDTLNKKYDFKMVRRPGGSGPSDHASFYAKKIPVLFYWTGDHPDYHRPSDTSDKINVEGMKKVADIAEETATVFAQTKDRPEYVKVASSSTGRPTGSVPRIGFQPSYGDDDDGVIMQVVSEGGPAAKAGLKDGDRIVEVAGKPVKNMEAYMSVMGGRKKGDPVDFTILRAGNKMTVTVTPE
jgi:hypothetical protein